MAHQEIELILMRQLADSLAMPMLLVDAAGRLVFYNEPVEKIVGCRFDETGALSQEEWLKVFLITDGKGGILKPEDRPLIQALTQRKVAHAALWIRGRDAVDRPIQATAFPLIGRGNRFLGAVVIFWEAGGE